MAAGPTIQDVLDKIDILETTLLARFTNLDTSILNSKTTVLAEIESLEKNIGSSVINQESYDEFTSSWESRIDNITTKAGQTFTPIVEYYLSQVQLKIRRDGLPGDVTVSLYNVDGSGHPTGDALAITTFADSEIPTSSEWFSFKFSTPWLVIPDTKYAIVVSATTLSSANAIYYKYGDIGGTTSEYDGGDRIEYIEYLEEWSVITTNDILFRTFSDTPSKLLIDAKISNPVTG